jgi:hypothetical protein
MGSPDPKMGWPEPRFKFLVYNRSINSYICKPTQEEK